MSFDSGAGNGKQTGQENMVDKPLDVLVIGSGGREHALCWKLRQSKRVNKLFCAPGNPGTAEVAVNVPINVSEIDALARFAEDCDIDLTVVGPELPLSLGIVDIFESRGLRIFGPSAEAAQLESSKSFAKEIMMAAGVPTAQYEVFYEEEPLRMFLNEVGFPVVLKADGLASGKGVFVCQSWDDVEAALPQLFGRLGASKIVAEECLTGREVSYIVATDGRRVYPCASSHDYKRIFDGQQGPNTGGMGSVSPSPFLPAEQALLGMLVIMLLCQVFRLSPIPSGCVKLLT